MLAWLIILAFFGVNVAIARPALLWVSAALNATVFLALVLVGKSLKEESK